MKINDLIICLTIVFVALLFPSAVRSQTGSFTYNNGNYALKLPSTKWRAIKVPGVAHDSTEFRYGDQGLVQMRIRGEIVDPGLTSEDLVQRRQQSDRVFLDGYVKGRVESFQGELSGTKYPYEYVTLGKPMARQIYYLEANDRFIYRVEFTGPPDELRGIGDQTDFIARSFRLR